MLRETYCFDDILLEPKKSDISSRSEVALDSSLSGMSFSLPIISSPMDTVTESDMATTMSNKGGLGIIHRYCTIERQCKMARESEATHKAAAIAVSGDYLDRASSLFNSGVRILCIDVAHGHHTLMERALKSIRDTFGEDICVIAGNIATAEAYADLTQWGADAIRVGIGGGSICSTRIQTGHGIPTFQSVVDCALVGGKAAIIADGGIKTAGDIVKSFAAGADFAMLGSMLAGTDESPGEILRSNDGSSFKTYRGMASIEAQVAWRGNARSTEGISTTVKYKGPVTEILSSLESNIKSGLSYSGARTLEELRVRASFIRQSSSSQVESNTHILGRR